MGEADRRADKGKAPAKVSQVLDVGDVVYVDPLNKEANTWRLRQVPEISGAMVVMDPSTGRVLAMVGGFSYDQSQFNRATQAHAPARLLVQADRLRHRARQRLYALDAGDRCAGRDRQGPGQPPWRPENYSSANTTGPRRCAIGIEQSRNTMTVRLAQDVGMPLIVEYARRFGVYDNLPAYLSFSLGAGETTVLRMVTAYSMFDNGGKRIIPTFIDRIQDRYGRTVYKHDQRECRGCKADKWKDQSEPSLVDRREQVHRSDDGLPDHLDHGRRRAARHRHGGALGRQADRRQDRHHQRREGRLVHRLLARHRGRRLHGLRQAQAHRPRRDRRPSGGADRRRLPKVALADKPAVPFRVPAGIKLIRVDAKTGMRAGPGEAR